MHFTNQISAGLTLLGRRTQWLHIFFATACLILLTAPPVQAQEAVFIVRHAEVKAQPGDEDPPLSEDGQQRALRFAEKLKNAGIKAIYSSETKRTQQTAEPSSKALEIPIRTVSRRDPKALVADVRDNHKTDRVLIFGHFQTIPWILKELGYQADIKLDSKVWDEMLIVIPKTHGQPTVIRVRL
jgi:phosphohistidine phosphatase SixA